MNRTFCAFGVLLALLTLAMLAVSSTTRSTTVNGAALRCAATGSAPAAHRCSLPLQRSISGQAYVLVVAASGVVEDSNECIDMPSLVDDGLALGAALNRGEWDGDCTTLKPARIEVAPRTNGARNSPTEASCLSVYDTIYDSVVYGAAALGAPGPPAPLEKPENVGLDELVSVFHDVLSSQRHAVSSRPANRELHSSWPVSPAQILKTLKQGARHITGRNAAAMMLGFQNWIGRQLDQCGAAPRWLQALVSTPAPAAVRITWQEYDAWAEPTAGHLASTSRREMTSSVQLSVQSSGWLLHSAAFSLSRLGMLLESAAEHLDNQFAR